MSEPTLPPALANLRCRPATPADLPLLAALHTAAHPEQPVVVETLERFEALRLPDEPFSRLLAFRDGELLGMAETGVPRMDGHDGWLNVDFVTLEPALAPALLEWAESEARRLGASTFVTRLNEEWWEKTVFEAAGYAEHDRMWPSTLDLTTLDFERFKHHEARAAAAGITLRPVSDFGEFNEAQQRRLYALMAALLRDVPSTTPISVWPFEVWQHRFVPRLRHPEGLFLAVAPDGEWVGLTELHQAIPSRPDTLHNGLTGVLPNWRGHGIAQALKITAARSALARGFKAARTSNHSINHPMLHINQQLGYEREAATITLIRACGVWLVEKSRH